MSLMRHRGRRTGFTLIELLTVIAIIAVLAAILFPVFSSARGKARSARCLSNMQQIGQAIEIYVQDNNGFYPTWSISHPRVPDPAADAANVGAWTGPADPTQPGPGIVTWDVSIGSYLREVSLLSCPDNPNSNGRTARSYAIAQYTQRPYNTGGSNWVAYGGFKDDIPLPARTVLLFEKGNYPPGAWGDALGQNVYQATGANLSPDVMWHRGGKNFLFCDYHAEWSAKGLGPFENQPLSSDRQGTCEDWGRPTATTPGDWPMPD